VTDTADRQNMRRPLSWRGRRIST